jgi:hypothetical protein
MRGRRSRDRGPGLPRNGGTSNRRGMMATTMALAALATACPSNPPTAPTPVPASSSATATGATSSPLPSLTATFVSPWYGYSVRYPIAWMTTNGKGPWPPGQVLRHDDPRLDVIVATTDGGQIRFVAASQPVPAGTTARRFGSIENPFSCPPGDVLPDALPIEARRSE